MVVFVLSLFIDCQAGVNVVKVDADFLKQFRIEIYSADSVLQYYCVLANLIRDSQPVSSLAHSL